MIRRTGWPVAVLQRVPQIGGLGVRELVAIEVVAHAGAERVGAEPPLEHAQDRAALLVREDVEHAVGVFGRDHLVLDRARVRERVDVERGRAAEREVVPRLPLGPVRVDAEVLHERRERLVEPDAVPPLHRHEVAEPHVRDLVHDRERGVGHLVERHLRRDRASRRVSRNVTQPRFSIAPNEKSGSATRSHFSPGIRDAVVVGEELDRERADVERERA